MQNIVKEELIITDYPEYYEFEDHKYYDDKFDDFEINSNHIVKKMKLENEVEKKVKLENPYIETEAIENEIKNEVRYHKKVQKQEVYIKEELMVSDYESSNDEETSPAEAPPAGPCSPPKSMNSAPSIQGNTYTFCSGCSRKSAVRARQARCIACGSPVSYHCERCDRSYKTYTSLNYHLYICHVAENLVFRCPSCPSQLRTAKLLAAHSRYCGKPKFLSCEHCSYMTKHKTSLQQHVSSNHTAGSFRCEKCGKVYKYFKTLRRHEALYCGSEKKFFCEHCPFRAFRKDQLPAHLRQKHRHIFQ